MRKGRDEIFRNVPVCLSLSWEKIYRETGWCNNLKISKGSSIVSFMQVCKVKACRLSHRRQPLGKVLQEIVVGESWSGWWHKRLQKILGDTRRCEKSQMCILMHCNEELSNMRMLYLPEVPCCWGWAVSASQQPRSKSNSFIPCA